MNWKNIFSSGTPKNMSKKTEAEIRHIEKQTSVELKKGYDLIKKYPHVISILGSARFLPDSPYYQKAESLAKRISKELGYAIVTGGGPGIMEAANKGAHDAGGVSIGFTIKLPDEQKTNPYVTDWADFEYFNDRKELIFFAAKAYIYFPGGFGTLDELFSVITVMQTGKIPKAPIILVDTTYWKSIFSGIEPQVLALKTINPEDTGIYTMVDTEDEILTIIKKAPDRNL